MTLVDTNIFVYVVDHDSPNHALCKGWMESCRVANEALCTTWPIVYELLRVVTHPGVLRRPFRASAALDFIDELFQSPSFAVLVATPVHAQFVRQIINETPNAAGNLMHDLHTAVLMREHGVQRICTHDADFRRFTGIEVIDPMQV